MKTILSLFLGMVVLAGINTVSAQSLFIVHPHKFYLERHFEDFRNNSFINSINEINEAFCDRGLDKYWVYDNQGNTFNRSFPIRKCGSKKLRSKWGDIGQYDFNIDQDVIVTGLYFNQCVSQTYFSIVKKFMNDKKMGEINIHFPAEAIILWGDIFQYDENELQEILLSQRMFIGPYGIENKKFTFDLEIYVNGKLQKEIAGDLKYGKKTVRMHLWSAVKDMLRAVPL